jgi:RimJ/RimL family protein N-acetyltransferase
MKAPVTIKTDRLILRRPQSSDAIAIFERYSSDPEVTRYLGWPRHQSVADTGAFLELSDSEWERWPAGPYLIFSRADGTLLGGSGFAFETPFRAATGYVLAKDAWGHGFATETLRAIMEIAPGIGIQRLYALCHPEHRPSWHVLEKCGFIREGILHSYSEFPNLQPGACDVLCYASVFGEEAQREEFPDAG